MSFLLKISIAIFIVVAIAIGSIFGFRILSSALDSTDYISQGNSYYDKGEYSSALASYQKALNKSSNPEIYIKIAKIYENKNRYNDSVDILIQGVDKNKDNSDLNFQLGEDASQLVSVDKTKADVAINAYEKASSSSKYKNVATYKKARLLSSKGDKDNLQKAQDLYNSLDFAPAKYELALFQLEEPDKALSTLNDAMSKTSNVENDVLVPEFGSWSDFGKALKEQLNNLKSDIQANKSKATVLNSKGYVAYKMNRCEFGIDNLKNAIAESEKDVFYPQARIVLGECLKRLNNYEDAKTYVLQVYEQQKDSLDARLILRQIYKGLGDKDNMIKIYDELISLDGQNIQLRQDYANDAEYISNWRNAAIQYSYLATHIVASTLIQGKANTDLSWNQTFAVKAYDLYTYKLSDYKSAENLISDVLQLNSKNIDTKVVDDLTAWVKYMQNPTNNDLRNDVYTKSQNLDTANALYHNAEILKSKGELVDAKENALLSYDKDENGYVAEKASELVKELD